MLDVEVGRTLVGLQIPRLSKQRRSIRFLCASSCIGYILALGEGEVGAEQQPMRELPSNLSLKRLIAAIGVQRLIGRAEIRAITYLTDRD